MEDIPILIAFYDQIDVLTLIMVRVFAFFMFLPVISGMSIPTQVRVMLAFFVSAAIFTSGLVTSVVYYPTTAGFFMLVLNEFITGAVMSFMLFFILNAILFAGQLMDYSIGLAMMNVMDPMMQIQVPIIGNLFFMSIMALLVVSDGIHYFMYAFFQSYTVIPIGAAFILGNESLFQFLIIQTTAFMLIAVQIAIPLVGAMILIDVGLGIMVKAVPQMNVFVVGMPLKVLIGFFLILTVLIPTLNYIYSQIFERMYSILQQVIFEIMPNEGG